MSFHGWNTVWAITWGTRCSVMFIRIKTSSTEEGMQALRSAQVCGVLRLRHGNRSWSRPLESMLVLGLYQHVSEPSQKRLSKVFIQQSVMPHQRLSKRHSLFEFPEKIKILYLFGTHAYRTERPVPKRFGTTTCTVTPLIETHKRKSKDHMSTSSLPFGTCPL